MTLVAIIDVIQISFLTSQSEYNPNLNPNLNQKVVFKLHPDFVPTIITVAKPPYEVHRHHGHTAVKHIVNPIMCPFYTSSCLLQPYYVPILYVFLSPELSKLLAFNFTSNHFECSLMKCKL